MSEHKIIVVGCGNMANAWVKYAVQRNNAEIVALVDINEENANLLKVRHNLSVPYFATVEEAVTLTGANLVFDVTIPAVHEQITISALTAGCHVMGEKPMATSMEAAYKMIEVAETSNKRYAVMQNRRFNNNIRAMKDLVSKENIGKIGMINADFFIGAHFGGFRDAMQSPLILDMAIHTFDQARFISGSDAVSVYTHEFNPAGSWYEGNAAAICIFEMSDGSVFCYRGSWCAEGVPTSWNANWRVIGSQGTAIWNGDGLPYAEVVKPDQTGDPFIREVERKEGISALNEQEEHDGCLDEMFTALEQGRRAETDCTDNIKSMAMVFGALESVAKQIKIML